ncbi:MAG: threonine synthase [Betaproteobacteria bacterium AqS2]|uniref:Threonine synthase n=1 Tax=Candidatus Amphirhobacter heronislandensis TaxID=1732024 RepID=A0A930UCL4_9GAMM|nr:threonine synthase [Betaproteobacteria bacterium AqS2]
MSEPRFQEGVIASHAPYLPKEAKKRPLSLGEGNTPLLHLKRLPAMHGIEFEVYVKYEGLNPTGSFKDRGMAVAVSCALARGAAAVACASTGNTSASAAAYAARAGLKCVVLLPKGKVAAGKLAQAHAHGAQVITVRGDFDHAMRAVKELGDEIEIVNSVNPMRIQGQKTIAFETVAQLGGAPDLHALPVGNAGNITAHWIGYSEWAAEPTPGACAWCGGSCDFLHERPADEQRARPRLLGVQAAGAAPFIAGAPVEGAETVATAIRIGAPQSWDQAQAAVAESKGWFTSVTDEEILAMQRDLAAVEGIFCEPASAASVAGLAKHAKAGKLAGVKTAVCTLTGHGLKDPDAVAAQPAAEADSDPAAIAAAIKAL